MNTKKYNVILLSKVIFPPLICWLILFYQGKNLFLFPLIFTLVIGLININKFKFNFLKSFTLCLFFSYFSFFTGYFGSLILGKILESLGDLGSIMAIIISAFVVAPILLYYSYSYSFNFYKKLCWAGLTTTDAFLTLYPKYLDPNDEINNPDNYNPEWLDIKLTIQAEIYSSSQTFIHPNGNTYQFLPKGSQPNSNEPCN